MVFGAGAAAGAAFFFFAAAVFFFVVFLAALFLAVVFFFVVAFGAGAGVAGAIGAAVVAPVFASCACAVTKGTVDVPTNASKANAEINDFIWYS